MKGFFNEKLIMTIIVIAFMFSGVFAQSHGYSSNRYYSQQYYISNVPAGSVYYRTDFYGWYIILNNYINIKEIR